MSERLPDWIAVKGEICHSIRRVGQRLPDWWIGDESSGMSQEEFEERATLKKSNLPLESDSTESAVKPRSPFAKPIEMGT